MAPKVLAEVLARPQVCARLGVDCKNRLTYEHAFGRKNEESWQIVILCWRHHLGDLLNKELNRHIAYSQIADEELGKKKLGMQMLQEKKYLIEKYGVYSIQHTGKTIST
jgi:hypothetical protein